MAITVSNVELWHSFDYWRNRHNELASAMSAYVVTTDSTAAVGNAVITGSFISNGVIVGNTTSNVVISPTMVLAPSIQTNTASFVTVNVGSSYINTTSIYSPNTYSDYGFYKYSVSVGNTNVNTTITPTSVTVSPSIYGNSYIFLSNTSANVTLVPPTPVQSSSGLHYLNANGSWTTIAKDYNPISNGQVVVGVGITSIDTFPISTFSGAEYTIHVQDNINNNQYFTKLLTSHSTTQSYITDYGGITPNNSIGYFSSGVVGGFNVLYFNSSTSATIKFARIIV